MKTRTRSHVLGVLETKGEVNILAICYLDGLLVVAVKGGQCGRWKKACRKEGGAAAEPAAEADLV